MYFGWMRVVVVLGCLFVLPSAWGQVSILEGNWNLTTDVEGATYGTVAINSLGVVTYTATFTNEFEGVTYTFDVAHTGKFVMNEENQLVYAGTASGEARDSNGEITVKLVVSGTGLLSSDGNVMVGVWVNKESYDTPLGTMSDEDGSSFIMVREGYDPGTPGEALAGVWQLHIQGDNIDWTGEVTLNPDGTLMGEYVPADVQNAAALAMAGLFSYSESKEFQVTYTTEPITLPVVGEVTFTFTGSGQGNEDNTYISGIWTFTVDVSDRVSQTFEGTFELTKLSDSDVLEWSMYQ